MEANPVTMAEYDAFCSRLPATSTVVQWGGAHVWKVGGKVFAIAWDDDPLARAPLVTFKCAPASFEMLSEMPGLRPAPYLASRGLKWIQRTSAETLDDDGLRAYLAESHRIVAAGLSKRQQSALGLAALPSRKSEIKPSKRASRARASRGERT
jgi:predicted DNA-binding protein (MmcQ/YjbR family)